ncbi:MAG: helix-turn-helix domain-containing protein [bacterium]|jgi:cytoskeleton protein RodZ
MSMHTSEDPKLHDLHAAGSAGREDGLARDGASAVTATQPDKPVADAPAMCSAGVMLAQARERCRLSVGDVANYLKLSMRQVEALEADAFDRLPSPMFIRGFVRSYARLVKVDPAQVLLALDQHLPVQPAVVLPQAGTREGAMRQPPPTTIPLRTGDQPSRRLHSLAALVAAVVVGFLAFEWLGPSRFLDIPVQAVRDAASPPVVQSGVAVPVQPAVATEVAPGDAGGDPAAASPVPSIPAAPGAGSSGALPAPVGASSSLPSDIGTTFSPGPRTVRLSFDRESWVEIKDARGRLILSQLNPPGSSQVVQGEPPLSLVVGNARSVRLAYGDREVDLGPYTRVDVARFTLD